MYEWQRQIQTVIEEIDACIRRRDDEALTLHSLAGKLGYSDTYMTKHFHEIVGLSLRDYLRARRLAFALIEVRDTERRLLDIALDYGFSSHEAFTRAFKAEYGVTPAAYRAKPVAVALRTRINAFDRYAFGLEEIGMVKTSGKINIYFTTIPAHRFLYIRNQESNGYWDFWQKQADVPGQDCHTICGLIDSIPGKLDDLSTGDISSGAGHVMAYEAAEDGGRFPCYPVPRWECYGCRVPADYAGPVPRQMRIRDVPAGAYIVFEHGAFDYEQECRTVEYAIDAAWDASTGAKRTTNSTRPWGGCTTSITTPPTAGRSSGRCEQKHDKTAPCASMKMAQGAFNGKRTRWDEVPEASTRRLYGNESYSIA